MPMLKMNCSLSFRNQKIMLKSGHFVTDQMCTLDSAQQAFTVEVTRVGEDSLCITSIQLLHLVSFFTGVACFNW